MLALLAACAVVYVGGQETADAADASADAASDATADAASADAASADTADATSADTGTGTGDDGTGDTGSGTGGDGGETVPQQSGGLAGPPRRFHCRVQKIPGAWSRFNGNYTLPDQRNKGSLHPKIQACIDTTKVYLELTEFEDSDLSWQNGKTTWEQTPVLFFIKSDCTDLYNGIFNKKWIIMGLRPDSHCGRNTENKCYEPVFISQVLSITDDEFMNFLVRNVEK